MSALVVSCLVAGCRRPPPAQTTTVIAVTAGEQWVSPDGNVALWGPPGWRMADSPPFGAAVVFVGQQAEGFATNLNLVILPLEHDSLAEHANAQQRNLEAAVGDVEVERPLEMDVSGQPALLAKLRFSQDELDLEAWQCHVRRGDQVYTVTLTGAAGTLDGHREEFHGTLASMRWTDRE